MADKQMQWRRMRADDLPEVNRVADIIHPLFPEDPAIFEERLRLYPDGCHVLANTQDDRTLHGYMISHPWMFGSPPPLNSLLKQLPQDPCSFYIHDIALLESGRGGNASHIVRQLQAHCRAMNYPNMTLIAVNGTPPFWARFGFTPHHNPALEAKLRSYSEDATYMVCDLRA